MSREVIAIDTEFIRLDALLKLAGAVPTGRAGQGDHSKRPRAGKRRALPAAGEKDAAGDVAALPETGQEIEVSA